MNRPDFRQITSAAICEAESETQLLSEAVLSTPRHRDGELGMLTSKATIKFSLIWSIISSIKYKSKLCTVIDNCCFNFVLCTRKLDYCNFTCFFGGSSLIPSRVINAHYGASVDSARMTTRRYQPLRKDQPSASGAGPSAGYRLVLQYGHVGGLETLFPRFFRVFNALLSRFLTHKSKKSVSNGMRK